ncbi:hypothetical protein ACFQ0I_07565 [Mariniflexile aquimaris]|uniref:Uncharacterized protein n=1 Tax=Mariniflexile aquimaris TaxID=881009 RepID=A0ABW3BSF4_9FLAO
MKKALYHSRFVVEWTDFDGWYYYTNERTLKLINPTKTNLN